HLADLGPAVRDEGLRTVDDPLAALEAGRGLRLAGVVAAARLGEPERTEDLAAAHRDEPPLFLFLGAVAVDGVRAEADAGLERDRDRRVDARQLLDGDAEREEIRALA